MRQRFIQSFPTSGTEHEAIDAQRLGIPYVAYIEDGRYIDWYKLSPPPPTPPEPTEIICTYNVTSAGEKVKIGFQINNPTYTGELEDGTVITLTGDNVYYNFSSTGPQKITFIRNGVKGNIPYFESCPKLTNIYIPEGYTKVQMSGFESCTGLTSITIPNSVTAITDGMNFAYCNRLKEVNIGTGLTTLGDQVFIGCSVLTAITINAVTPPKIGTSVLHAAANAYFYVPDEAVEAYKAAPTWANYADRVKGISEKPQ